MNFSTALVLIKRVLGCRIVGHEWSYTTVWDGAKAIESRDCEIAVCQRHEVREAGRWVQTEAGRPGL